MSLTASNPIVLDLLDTLPQQLARTPSSMKNVYTFVYMCTHTPTDLLKPSLILIFLTLGI